MPDRLRRTSPGSRTRAPKGEAGTAVLHAWCSRALRSQCGCIHRRRAATRLRIRVNA
jgi:hypothetical protein